MLAAAGIDLNAQNTGMNLVQKADNASTIPTSAHPPNFPAGSRFEGSAPRAEPLPGRVDDNLEQVPRGTGIIELASNIRSADSRYLTQSVETSETNQTLVSSQFEYQNSVPAYISATQASLPSEDHMSHDEDETDRAPKMEISQSTETGALEYHGEASYLSICSQAGANWASSSLGLSDFTSSAMSLRSFVSGRLKLQTELSSTRAPEPDAPTAWKYAKGFFEECLEIPCVPVQREIFNSYLRAFFKNHQRQSENPAWYALRHVIYAFGARIVHYSKPSENAWIEAQRISWRYFENALSVHTQLIYCCSQLQAVESLLLMALFAEGIGNPKLEYMLISNATRLAQSKGLHLDISEPDRPQGKEQEYRSVLFWSIYCYEKHNSSCSDRASAIDDDNISCPYPSRPLHGSKTNLEIFLQIIELARIKSAVSKQLLSVSARRQSQATRLELKKTLETRLQKWRSQLPAKLRFEPVCTSDQSAPEVRKELTLYYHLAYHALLITINDAMGNPWDKETSKGCPERCQVALAPPDNIKHRVAEASREIIRSLRHVPIDSAAPTWLTVLYPILGMIHLFIHIVTYPSLPSVASDIQLIDMAASYFGHLDYSTGSSFALGFIRDLVHWARVRTTSASADKSNIAKPVTRPVSPITNALNFLPAGMDEFFSNQSWISDTSNAPPADWENLISSLPQVSAMPWNDDCNIIFER
ncbi:hypothetical protein, variant [Exophiala oligosperma]|nr:hypothetical protein, variant [Exophiala oligosperma]KIW45781.1 hypothetical protein, variant [Exophiala oligosperma]